MPRDRKLAQESISDAAAMRIGAAVLGTFAGALLGLFVSLVLLFAVGWNASIPTWVFGGAATGAAIGLATAEAGFALVEGAVHFFVGLLSSLTYSPIEPNDDAPQWLKWLLWCGFAAGIVFAVWWTL
jgi:hypothetical protein